MEPKYQCDHCLQLFDDRWNAADCCSEVSRVYLCECGVITGLNECPRCKEVRDRYEEVKRTGCL